MLARDMISGCWYKQERHGRFVAGEPDADKTMIMCYDNGDQDMQSCFFLRFDAPVMEAETEHPPR